MDYRLNRRRISSAADFESDHEYKTILEVQQRLYAICKNNKALFDESDVANIDVKRWILLFVKKQNYDVEKSVEMMKKSLIWYKEKNLPRLNLGNWPREYFEIGGIVMVHGKDLDGNFVVYSRMKYFIVTEETEEFYDRLRAFYEMNAIKKGLLMNKGITIFFDNTNITTECINVSFCLSNLKILTTLMPDGIKNILMYSLPWFAKPAFKVLSQAMPNEVRKLVKFVSSSDINKIIAEDQLPNFIRNPKAKYNIVIPESSKYIDQMDVEAIGVRNEQREKFKAHFKKLTKIAGL